jgi:hypothetical protein
MAAAAPEEEDNIIDDHIITLNPTITTTHAQNRSRPKPNLLEVVHLFSSPLFTKDEEGGLTECDELAVVSESEELLKILQASKLKIRFRSVPATNYEILIGCSDNAGSGGDTVMILHYSGHGDREGLLFERDLRQTSNDMATGRHFSIENIEKINEHFKPTVVFVSACESEDVGLAFVYLGVPHVIAVKR